MNGCGQMQPAAGPWVAEASPGAVEEGSRGALSDAENGCKNVVRTCNPAAHCDAAGRADGEKCQRVLHLGKVVFVDMAMTGGLMNVCGGGGGGGLSGQLPAVAALAARIICRSRYESRITQYHNTVTFVVHEIHKLAVTVTYSKASLRFIQG